MKLNADQLDVLCEVFNIGVGRAAAALSRLIGGVEIQLSVPSARLLTIEALAAEIGAEQEGRVCAISQSYDGPFSGTAQLIYTEQESLEMVRVMLGADTPIDRFSEAEAEALCEIGNIVLNSCVGSFGNMFKVEFTTGLPTIATDTILNVLCEFGARDVEDLVLELRVDFNMAAHNLTGHLTLNMDVGAIEQLREMTDVLLSGVDD